MMRNNKVESVKKNTYKILLYTANNTQHKTHISIRSYKMLKRKKNISIAC